MRLNLYTATCSLLAYGVTALNLSATFDVNHDISIFSQTYADEFTHDLA